MPRLLLLGLLLGLSSCRDGGDENLGLGQRRRDLVVDLKGLHRPGEIEKALALPQRELAARLGPHRFVGTTHLALIAGESRDTLDEEVRLASDSKGGLHLVREDSHQRGFEWLFVDGQLHVRPRYGQFVHRSPEGDELERRRDELAGQLLGYLAVLGRFTSRAVDGSEAVAGRQAIRVKLARAAAPSPPKDSDPRHAWRKTITVDRLDGTVWLEKSTGTPLGSRLAAHYRCERPLREGGGAVPIDVEIQFDGQVEPLAADFTVAAPAVSAASPTRPRPLVDRQLLLDGLAPLKGKRLELDHE